MTLHTDQATLDHWRTTGTWVMFGEGGWAAVDLLGGSAPVVCLDRESARAVAGRLSSSVFPWRTQQVAPAWMVEAARSCETCGGKAKVPGAYHGPADLLFACPGCDDGRQRHTITVPCDHPEHENVKGGLWLCAIDGPPHDNSGRITVHGLAVVQWGPLVVDRIGSATTNEAVIVGANSVWHVRQFGDDLIPQRITLPPDLDPQSLVGQYAIGGRLVTP